MCHTVGMPQVHFVPLTLTTSQKTPLAQGGVDFCSFPFSTGVLGGTGTLREVIYMFYEPKTLAACDGMRCTYALPWAPRWLHGKLVHVPLFLLCFCHLNAGFLLNKRKNNCGIKPDRKNTFSLKLVGPLKGGWHLMGDKLGWLKNVGSGEPLVTRNSC